MRAFNKKKNGSINVNGVCRLHIFYNWLCTTLLILFIYLFVFASAFVWDLTHWNLQHLNASHPISSKSGVEVAESVSRELLAHSTVAVHEFADERVHSVEAFPMATPIFYIGIQLAVGFSDDGPPGFTVQMNGLWKLLNWDLNQNQSQHLCLLERQLIGLRRRTINFPSKALSFTPDFAWETIPLNIILTASETEFGVGSEEEIGNGYEDGRRVWRRKRT